MYEGFFKDNEDAILRSAHPLYRDWCQEEENE